MGTHTRTHTHTHTSHTHAHTSGTSVTICKSFRCSEFDVGSDSPQRYLTADMSVDCDSDEYTAIIAWAGVTLVMLPVGVPAVMHWVMYKNRDAIEARDTRNGGNDLKHLAVWFAPYKRDKWW